MIIRYVFSFENGMYRERGNAVYSAENGSNTADDSTVIKNTFDGFGQSGTGSDRTIQDQNIFPFDHRLIIITENKLTGIAKFRCDHVNGLVGMHGKYAGFGQFF